MTDELSEAPADMRTLQVRGLALKRLADTVAEMIRSNKAQLEMMTPGQSNKVILDGTEVGTVTKTMGARSWTVTDNAAHLAWIDKHHPTEVEVEVRVRPQFTKSYVVVGEHVLDPDGLIVEGVAVRHGEPFVTVRDAKSDTARDLLWDAIGGATVRELVGNE